MVKFLKRGKLLVLCALLCLLFATVASAAGSGDVASAVESTWTTASTQIKTVVDNVVFPVIDMVLAIAFFVKLGTAYFDYRKSGQFAANYGYNTSRNMEGDDEAWVCRKQKS